MFLSRFYCVLFFLLLVYRVQGQDNVGNDRILACAVSADKIQLYWKDDRGVILGSLANLERYVISRKQQLLFAMNAGMYQENRSPLGLFIYRHQVLRQLNKASGKGNFYLQPNGVFYITRDNKAAVVRTAAFRYRKDIRYATQSGPMLLVNGQIKKGSANLNIRNGVGRLPDGRLVLAMSRVPVNFYDFALFFNQLGCRDALYLDGFVSRAYWPAQHWLQTDGDFGVMIGVVQ